MKIKFQANDQVVAVPIDGPDWSRWERAGYNVPYPGCIYTVRDVYACFDNYDKIGCRLVEVVNKPSMLKDGTTAELGWDAREFQPVKKTDISNLKKLERPNKPKNIIIHPKAPVKEKV